MVFPLKVFTSHKESVSFLGIRKQLLIKMKITK